MKKNYQSSRRSFIKNISFATAFFAVGGFKRIHAANVYANKTDSLGRFMMR
jgi:hypothetical protein